VLQLWPVATRWCLSEWLERVWPLAN